MTDTREPNPPGSSGNPRRCEPGSYEPRRCDHRGPCPAHPTPAEADFCQAPGSISRALEELRDYPGRKACRYSPPCSRPPRRWAPHVAATTTWELRVANYASVGILCAKHPRVLDRAIDYMLETSRTGWATTRRCASSTNWLPLPAAGQRHEGLLQPGRALLNSVVPRACRRRESSAPYPVWV